MKAILALLCISATSIHLTASNVHRLSTTTVCPQTAYAATMSPEELETRAYNAAVERLKTQLFRVFEKYGVTAGPVDEQLENQTREEADAVLKKIHEVLPSESKLAAPFSDDDEQATLYIPLPNRRCSPLESGHCFSVDMRGINFNGEKDGALNLYVKGLTSTGSNSKHEILVYEESLANSSSHLELVAKVMEDVHVNQRKWVKIPVQSAKLGRWHSRETTKLVVRINNSLKSGTAALMLDLESLTMRPYLELAPQKIRQRTRRSASQASVGNCEMRVVEVPSSTLDSRILAPNSLKVRFCTGQCTTWTLAEAIRLRMQEVHGASIARCCVPSSYANVTILWKEDVNKNSIVHLNKAFPTSCKCM